LKLQRFCPFTLNGVMSRFAELHCGSVASRCSLQKLSNFQLLKLRQKRQPIKSDTSTSSSQSNCVLVCLGREIHVIGCWSSFRQAHQQASTHAALWTLRNSARACVPRPPPPLTVHERALCTIFFRILHEEMYFVIV